MAEKESWAAQCHTREDCRENERGWGRLGGHAYQCVCEDRAERAGCMNHNRMEKLVETHTYNIVLYLLPRLPFCLSHTHAHIMSSNTAERLGVYGYLMKHPPLSSSTKSAH